MVFSSFAFSVVFTALMFGPSSAQEIIGVPRPRPDLKPEIVEKKPEQPVYVYQSACPALLNGEIDAKILPQIKEGECGERSPLALNAIVKPQKVDLSSSPQLNCRTASAIAEWVLQLNAAAKATLGSTVTKIISGNGYQCRRRNNRADGKISEHGFANAIDITGFWLADGKDVIIERDWPMDEGQPTNNGMFLRQVHQSACKIFTTVLGPQANQLHHDHFHFDLGCHGKRCTYLLCE